MSDGREARQQASADDAILETKDVTKRFGGLTAINDLNIAIPRGELRCIIGPNGAGKSTLFNIITGRITPSSGEVWFQGENITALEPHERIQKGMSLKFQEINLYWDLTVRQNMRVPVQKHYPDDEIEERIDDYLDLVGLREEGDMVVDNLSHGEQQWLEMAMSMGTRPSLLLLDEPTAGMTIEETRQTGELVKSLIDDDTTIIAVEHDINFVRRVADKVTVLHNGELFAEGNISEIEANTDVQDIYLGKEASHE
jgi:branched-chain amino acid transport system ATP-binding protein